MRYSVTVKRPASVIPPGHQSRTSAIDPDPLGRGSYVPTVSRRTGLTLHEAMDVIRPYCESGTNLWDLGAPEEGGTIGPLADGTVIVVECEEES